MATGATATNKGANTILKRLYGTTVTAVTQIRIGYGTTTPAATDTVIESPIELGTLDTIDACDAVTGWSTGGNASAEVLNTTAGEFIEGTGCLNLPTSGGGACNWDKTITTVDLSTAGDELRLFLYIADVSDLSTSASAVQIELGTGGFTNTNKYNFANTTFATDGVWYPLVCDVDAPDATAGTGADETDIDRIRISVNLGTDQVTNDMRMDFWRKVESGDFAQNFTSGYPTFDTSARTSEWRGSVSANQANGYRISEAGGFNTESTPEMEGHDVYTTISKTSKDQLIYIITNKVTPV
jgi:hypothetical protein